ncbi:MAG: hypothetical protein ACOC9Y_01075 [Chloroflexota bacterium]
MHLEGTPPWCTLWSHPREVEGVTADSEQQLDDHLQNGFRALEIGDWSAGLDHFIAAAGRDETVEPRGIGDGRLVAR